MEYVSVPEVTILPDIKLEPRSNSVSVLTPMKPIRVGAYVVDRQTTVIRWRGEPLRLSEEQRQMLHVMLQHAGQIMSCERLASLVRTPAETIDARISSLRAALEAAGVTWLPRRAEGCGYILWR